MSLTKTEKQPSEQYYIEGEFDEVLGTGEVITGTPTATVVDNAGTDATTDIIVAATLEITADERGVTVQIKGGTEAKSPYKITIKVETDLINKFEVDGLIYVKDE